MKKRAPRQRNNESVEAKTPKKRVRPARPAEPVRQRKVLPPDEAGVVRQDAWRESFLAGATPVQIRWVTARLMTKSDTAAAKLIGLNVSSVRQWRNKKKLDEAVRMYTLDTVEAAKVMLTGAASRAVDALERGLDGRRSIEAARAILDRAGVPGVQKRELAGGISVNSSTDNLTDQEFEDIARGGGSGASESETGES